MNESCDGTEKKLNLVIGEIDGIKKGFLDSKLQHESLTKNNKNLLGINEELMRMLEKLDSLTFEVCTFKFLAE